MPTMSYERARGLMLWAGLIIVGLVALTMSLRDVDPIEISATLFYAPIFAGFLLFGFGAGVTLGLAAAGAYIGLRIPALELVGFAPIAGTIIARVVGYVAFGAVGGWAADQLKVALERFRLIDELDEETGLGNARSIVNAIERELSRAERYSTAFSVVIATFDTPQGRRPAAKLGELGSKVAMSVRSSDHAAHARIGDRHQVVIVLPETGESGAATVATNLETLVGSVVGGDIDVEAITDRGDVTQPIAPLVERFKVSDRR